ncbi:unnamed protein product [Fraxinus pennsylvanica]|uniref:Uncharacterized protein n=1 Tax=Fraxinus pennsylvanica TaxID=56036 RepID=A0AAD1ZVJ9_9LAMI|nr:unnamed protein product [Fraxinus pennsylvanica]
MSCVDNLDDASPSCVEPTSSICFDKEELSEATGTKLFPPLSFLDALGNSVDLPFLGLETQIPSQLSFSMGESVSLPPLSSLLATARQSSCLTSKLPHNIDHVPLVDFPPLLPEPLVRLPLPLQFPIPTSQQIVTFSPLTCDPIVHVPIIEVCSSGQGYLVSAGPTMSTTIPSLGSDLVNPLISDVESAVEKGARETLRLLISSSNQPNPQLLDVFPSMLASSNHKQNILAISNGITAMGMVPFSEKSFEGSIGKGCISRDDSVDQKEKPAGFGPSFFEDYCSNSRDEKTN